MTVEFDLTMMYVVTACCAVAVVENLLVMVVFAGTKNLHIKYYTFIFNLALADFLFSISQIALIWGHNVKVFYALVAATYAVSILMILTVAVNRYLALILMPSSRYDALVTRRRLIGFA